MKPLPAAGEVVATRVVAFATTAFLVVAPVTSSSGLRIALLVVSLLATAHIAFHHGRARLPGPLPLAITLAYAAWAALATATLLWSVDPAYSASELRREVLYGALAFCAFYFAATDEARFRQWAVALLAGTAALGVAEVVRAALAPHGTTWHGGPGRFTTHLVLVAPFLVLLLADRPAGLGRHRAWLSLLVVAYLASALESRNRIAWIAFLASLVVMALVLRADKPSPHRRAAAIGIVALALAIGALFAVSMVQKLDSSYPTAASAGESLSMDQRPLLWSIARGAVAERPWTGYGFGREILQERYRAGAGSIGYEFATHGHNSFVNAAVSMGWPGALLLALLFVLLAAGHARNLRHERTRLAGAIGLALLAGFVVKNQTDDFFIRHNALVFWALNGLLLGFGRRPGLDGR